MSVASESVLTDRLLEKCRERAPKYDQENRFCQEDFDDLKAAGYLLMAVPRELGGLGMSLEQKAAAYATLRERFAAAGRDPSTLDFCDGLATVDDSLARSMEQVPRMAEADS